MNLFTSRLDAERLGRATDPTTRTADRDALLSSLSSETVPLISGARSIAYVGSETPRERIWLQFDSCADDAASAIAAWGAVESLTSEQPARYRIPVTGRARLAVLFGDGALPGTAPPTVPFLDAGALGAHPPLLAALQRFSPSLAIHVQDWTTDTRVPLRARLIESFRLDPDLHAALPASGSGRRFTRARRAFLTAASGPDWTVGARTVDYVRRLGFRLRELTPERGTAPPDRHAVLALAPTRFLPALPYRRLGGGNLGELALAACGAHAVTLQLRGGGALERAGLALAVAEGAIVHRMGLHQESGE